MNKPLLSLLMLACGVCLSDAEAAPDAIPSVSFAPFPRGLVRTHVHATHGTPADEAELNSPFPNDFPPCAIIGFEDGQESAHTGRYYSPARNILRVYNIAEIKTAPYRTIQVHIEHLRKLLIKRPARVPSGEKHGDQYDKLEQLPDYPPRNAGHLLQVKMAYVDAPWGSGLFYISQFVQGIGEWPDNEQLVYLFQGLSKNGNYFVSADFRITHPKLPEGIDETPDEVKGEDPGGKKAEELTSKITSTLAKEPDNSFTPSLSAIRHWITTLKIDE